METLMKPRLTAAQAREISAENNETDVLLDEILDRVSDAAGRGQFEIALDTAMVCNKRIADKLRELGYLVTFDIFNANAYIAWR